MNPQRAKEIAASPDMITVTHNGEPIYIQHIDEANKTARVFPLGKPENEQEVPLRNLEEE